MPPSSDEPSAQQEAPISGGEWQSIWEQYVDPEQMDKAQKLLTLDKAKELAEEILEKHKCEPQMPLEWFAQRCQLIIAIGLEDLARVTPSPKSFRKPLKNIAKQSRNLSNLLKDETLFIDIQDLELQTLLAQQLSNDKEKPGETDFDRLFVSASEDLLEVFQLATSLNILLQAIRDRRTDFITLADLASKAATALDSLKGRHSRGKDGLRARDFFIHNFAALFFIFTGKYPTVSKIDADDQSGKFIWFLKQIIPQLAPTWDNTNLPAKAHEIVAKLKFEMLVPPYLEKNFKE